MFRELEHISRLYTAQNVKLIGMTAEIIFQVTSDLSDGGYVASALGHSIVTQGESVEELRLNVRDAVHCHFEPQDMPKIIRLHFVRDEVLAV